MTRHANTCFLPLAAMSLLLVGCAGDPPSEATAPSTKLRPDVPTRLDHLAEGDSLDPGTYALTARRRRDMPLAVLEVPSGFTAGGDFLTATGKGFGAMGYWKVTGTYPDPCSKRGGHKDAGHTVDELAAALASQQMLSATKPVPVSIGGHQAAYLEMTAPRFDYQKCKENDVDFWRSDEGDLYSPTPGSAVRTWILDVDGTRVVLNTYVEPGATEQQTERLNQVVESIRFIGRDGATIS